MQLPATRFQQHRDLRFSCQATVLQVAHISPHDALPVRVGANKRLARGEETPLEARPLRLHFLSW